VIQQGSEPTLKTTAVSKEVTYPFIAKQRTLTPVRRQKRFQSALRKFQCFAGSLWVVTLNLGGVKWGMASSAACECGAEEQTVDHVVLQCSIHRPPHGLHGLTVLDDETTEWLLNTYPEIQRGQAVDERRSRSNERRSTEADALTTRPQAGIKQMPQEVPPDNRGNSSAQITTFLHT